jgi:hypothetical protein
MFAENTVENVVRQGMTVGRCVLYRGKECIVVALPTPKATRQQREYYSYSRGVPLTSEFPEHLMFWRTDSDRDNVNKVRGAWVPPFILRYNRVSEKTGQELKPHYYYPQSIKGIELL